MKRMITFLAAALLPLPAMMAEDGIVPEPACQSRTYPLRDFNKLDIRWCYQVELSKSAQCSVRVEASEDILPYLDVHVSNGTLVLRLKREISPAMQNRFHRRRGIVRAYVSMPELHELEMSGASRLTASGCFETPGAFSVDLCGASSATGLVVRSPGIEMECSGSTRLEMEGVFKNLEADLSGASVAILKGDAETVSADLSGASKFQQKGNVGSLEIDASGGACYTLDGELESILLDGSGASSVETLGAPARRARIDLSGAASARIHVKEKLEASLSGASKLRYRGDPELKILEKAGGASLDRL